MSRKDQQSTKPSAALKDKAVKSSGNCKYKKATQEDVKPNAKTRDPRGEGSKTQGHKSTLETEVSHLK